MLRVKKGQVRRLAVCGRRTLDSYGIRVVSRKRPGEYRIWGGSFIGGGGCREAAADEAAEYLSWSPHWAHLMRLTLGMGWDDVHRSLATK
jgi:hypothetical protein